MENWIDNHLMPTCLLACHFFFYHYISMQHKTYYYYIIMTIIIHQHQSCKVMNAFKRGEKGNRKKNRTGNCYYYQHYFIYEYARVCVCDAFIKFHHQNHIKFIIMCHNQNSIIFYDAGDFLTDPPLFPRRVVYCLHSHCPTSN